MDQNRGFLIGLALLSLFAPVGSIRCYVCNDDPPMPFGEPLENQPPKCSNAAKVDCSDPFIFSPFSGSQRNRRRKRKPAPPTPQEIKDMMCVKRYEFGKAYKICAPYTDLSKISNRLEDEKVDQCTSAGETTFCACSTDLCNEGSSVSFPFSLFGLVGILLIHPVLAN